MNTSIDTKYFLQNAGLLEILFYIMIRDRG